MREEVKEPRQVGGIGEKELARHGQIQDQKDAECVSNQCSRGALVDEPCHEETESDLT